ncbi:MAG: hypothetical protein SGILL_003370 [Bacillariaceae sp.]
MGKTLRSYVQSSGIQGSLDDKTFATACASLFVIIAGILMLPEFLGGAFNPFFDPPTYVKSIVMPPTRTSNNTSAQGAGETDPETDDEPLTRSNNRRRKAKKKKTN